MIPNILSIAGSDPSGGAGIQADIKSISANGGYAMAALTALTAQNTQGVTGIELVPPGFVGQQIDTVFEDIEVHAVKIGMIATAEIAEAVADALSRNKAVNVVLDPVMVAKGGDRLLREDAVAALKSRLVPLATVITPNLPEAAELTGEPEITSRDQMPALAHKSSFRSAPKPSC
jgi:hydroxymethylpyrimidine/phosphomethylpyrimidine kinase